MCQPKTVKENALIYLYKRLKKTRISLGKAEWKNNAGDEVNGLKRKIEVLEYLTEIVLKEDERR